MAFANRKITTSSVTAVITGSDIAAHLALGEIMTGAVDGVNTIFTTSATVISNQIDVYLNGQRQKLTTDYAFNGTNTVTFVVAPEVGMTPPEADYIH